MIYLDSCALVKLVLAEKETPSLEAFRDGRRSEILSCQLALTDFVTCDKTLARAVTAAGLPLAQPA